MQSFKFITFGCNRYTYILNATKIITVRLDSINDHIQISMKSDDHYYKFSSKEAAQAAMASIRKQLIE